MKYFGGCDVGSTYTKAVILDENGKMVADTTIRSKINSEASAVAAMEEVCSKAGLKDSKELAYLIGTGYGRNKVPFADENISEISCHAMGVHITDPTVKAIIDIGGQDVKGISIDTAATARSISSSSCVSTSAEKPKSRVSSRRRTRRSSSSTAAISRTALAPATRAAAT